MKTSMEKLASDKLHKGVSPYDVMCWLSYLKSENLDVRGIELGFKWKPVKPRGGFTVANIYKDILSRDGNYVLTGMAKKKNAVWFALMTRLGGGKKRKTREKVKKAVVKELSEERKIAICALVADDVQEKNAKCIANHIMQKFSSQN